MLISMTVSFARVVCFCETSFFHNPRRLSVSASNFVSRKKTWHWLYSVLNRAGGIIEVLLVGFFSGLKKKLGIGFIVLYKEQAKSKSLKFCSSGFQDLKKRLGNGLMRIYKRAGKIIEALPVGFFQSLEKGVDIGFKGFIKEQAKSKSLKFGLSGFFLNSLEKDSTMVLWGFIKEQAKSF